MALSRVHALKPQSLYLQYGSIPVRPRFSRFHCSPLLNCSSGGDSSPHSGPTNDRETYLRFSSVLHTPKITDPKKTVPQTKIHSEQRTHPPITNNSSTNSRTNRPPGVKRHRKPPRLQSDPSSSTPQALSEASASAQQSFYATSSRNLPTNQKNVIQQPKVIIEQAKTAKDYEKLFYVPSDVSVESTNLAAILDKFIENSISLTPKGFSRLCELTGRHSSLLLSRFELILARDSPKFDFSNRDYADLIILYTKIHQIEKANVYLELLQKELASGVRANQARLFYYARIGDTDAVENLLTRFIKSNFVDIHFFDEVFSLLAIVIQVDITKLIIKHFHENNFALSINMIICALETFQKSNDLAYVDEILKDLFLSRVEDIKIIERLVSVLKDLNQPQFLNEALERQHEIKKLTNDKKLVRIIQSYTNRSGEGKLAQLESQLRAEGVLDRNIFIVTTLMHSYGKLMLPNRAFRLWQELMNSSLPPTAWTYSVIISICGDHLMFDELKIIENQLYSNTSIMLESHLINTLIKCYTNHPDDAIAIREVNRILALKEKLAFSHSPVSLSLLIRFYHRLNMIPELEETLARLLSLPNVSLSQYTQIITIFAERNQLDSVKAIVSVVKELKLQPDHVMTKVLNSLSISFDSEEP